MRNGFLISLASLIFAAGAAAAQDPPTPPDQSKTKPAGPGPGPLVEVTPKVVTGDHQFVPGQQVIGGQPFGACSPEGCWADCCDPGACCDANRCWGSLEYLLWWVKDGPVPGPLVTTGNPNDGKFAGTLGRPDTRVLFGQSELDYGSFSGARLILGGWFDCDRTCGIEVSGFLLDRQSVVFNAASDNTGNPPLYVPAFNVSQNREDSLIVADPLQRFGGNVQWQSASRLWGTEVNGLWAACNSCNCQFVLLGGFRYADLQESLRLDNTTNDLVNDVTTTLHDNFGTRNQFCGAQVGGKVSYRDGGWSLDLIGKVAVGNNRQLVDVSGSITQFGADATTPGTFPGGFFTQPTNLGRVRSDECAVIPEFEVKVGYDICCNVRAFMGYDVMYWNNVVRPGNQVDRNLNLTQSPIFGDGQLQGLTAPTPLFNKSDFWAHGVSLGLELRY